MHLRCLLTQDNKMQYTCSNSPEANLAYRAGHFFMGAKMFIRSPKMRNKAVLKINLFWLCEKAWVPWQLAAVLAMGRA